MGNNPDFTLPGTLILSILPVDWGVLFAAANREEMWQLPAQGAAAEGRKQPHGWFFAFRHEYDIGVCTRQIVAEPTAKNLFTSAVL
ncbi:hypothetical protein FRC08_013807 [Ceratobasidium sp. 394]|nr:hypothetical protein FRC08_013807 [Ceratobasidium sp. 394]